MSDSIVIRHMVAENRLFVAALTLSLLLHLLFFWFGQELTTKGNVESSTPEFSAIKVAFAPARSTAMRSVVERQQRRDASIKAPSPQISEVAPQASQPSETTTAEVSDATDDPHQDVTEINEAASDDGGSSNAGMLDHYLAMVLARIESHKFYPAAAQRRGIQGRVEVRFRLDARGSISDLAVTGSNSLFVEAATAAVRKATPLPEAPTLDGFPLAVRYQMIFKLH